MTSCPKCGKPIIRAREFVWPDGTTGQFYEHRWEQDPEGPAGKLSPLPNCFVPQVKGSGRARPFMDQVIEYAEKKK